MAQPHIVDKVTICSDIFVFRNKFSSPVQSIGSEGSHCLESVGMEGGHINSLLELSLDTDTFMVMRRHVVSFPVHCIISEQSQWLESIDMQAGHVTPLDSELSFGKEGKVGVQWSVVQHDTPIFVLILFGKLILPLMLHQSCDTHILLYDFLRTKSVTPVSWYMSPHGDPGTQSSLGPVHEFRFLVEHCVQESV